MRVWLQNYGEGHSTQGRRTIHGRFQTASRFRTVRACFKCLVPSRRACGKTATGPPGGACPDRQQESGRPCASPTGPPAMRPTFTMSVCSRRLVGTLWWSYGRDILKALASLRSDCSRSIGTVFTFAAMRSVLVTVGSSVAIASMHPPRNLPCRPPDSEGMTLGSLGVTGILMDSGFVAFRSNGRDLSPELVRGEP